MAQQSEKSRLDNKSTLGDVPFDGWEWPVVEKAAETLGYDAGALATAFPDQLQGVVLHFSDWADRQMMEALAEIDSEELRVRERIARGVSERLKVLMPHKEAFRSSTKYWLNPLHKMAAGKMVWKTADAIWIWAGDVSTDYNHYSKRTLLSGVITTTMLAWLRDETDGAQETLDFLDHRIDNVLQFGKFVGGLKKCANSLKSMASKG